MRARISDPQKTKAAGRRAPWPAILFAVAAVVWTAAMVASLEWRFLDRFVVGSWHGKIGVDFFQVPRGYNNLLIGNSIFLTASGDYGPYARMYLNHPSWPWPSGHGPRRWPPGRPFGCLWSFRWACCSSVRGSWPRPSKPPPIAASPTLRMFCSLPTYLMLWNAQAHVLLVAGRGADSQRADAVGRGAAAGEAVLPLDSARAADLAAVEAGGRPDAAGAVPVAGNAAKAAVAPWPSMRWCRCCSCSWGGSIPAATTVSTG